MPSAHPRPEAAGAEPAGRNRAAGRQPSVALFEAEDLAFDQTGPFHLALRAGECMGLSGPSGSGKTRLLRCIADLDVHRGRMWLDGAACEDIPPPSWRRRVALLPAESAWWYDEVGAHFAEPPASATLAALGFPEAVLAWRVDRLSSGEKQRLAVLRVLAIRPRVLLLDEPTANLDEANIERVESLILDYLHSESAAAIWVSHDERQLQRVAGRRYRIVDGRLVEAETSG